MQCHIAHGRGRTSSTSLKVCCVRLYRSTAPSSSSGVSNARPSAWAADRPHCRLKIHAAQPPYTEHHMTALKSLAFQFGTRGIHSLFAANTVWCFRTGSLSFKSQSQGQNAVGQDQSPGCHRDACTASASQMAHFACRSSSSHTYTFRLEHQPGSLQNALC